MLQSKSKRVLFIHHGSHDGGAPISMLYTMIGLKKSGYNPVAGFINPSNELHNMFNKYGFSTSNLERIPRFLTYSASEGKRLNPVTWYYVFRAIWKWRKGQEQLLNFIEENNIDIVHLNSASLSNPASLLVKIKVPFIWHIREHGPNNKGLRFKFIQKKMKQAKHLIFISKADQKSWLIGYNSGKVVYNFIDFNKFVYKPQIKNNSNKQIKTILYLGGIHAHKGINVLLDSLKYVKDQFGGQFKCLMPGSYVEVSEQNSFQKKMLLKLVELELEEQCILMPFSLNVVELYRKSDVLVFPATVPHFARPVIEASAMKVPVVASNLKSIDELVIHGETGFLVDAFSAKDFSDAILNILYNPELARSLGESGYIFAKENFEENTQMDKIIKIYSQLNE